MVRNRPIFCSISSYSILVSKRRFFLALEILRPSSRLLILISYTGWLYFLLATRNPQLMEDFESFRFIAKYFHSVFIILAFIFALFLCAALIPSKKIKNFYGIRWLFWTIFPIYLFLLNSPNYSVLWNYRTASKIADKTQENLIFIGVGGLDRDLLIEQLQTGAYPYTNAFFKNSVVYSKSYTEIARPESSLMGLVSGIPPHESNLRSSLESPELAIQELEKQSHIQNWKKEGGDFLFRFSDSENFNFDPFIGKVKHPSTQAISIMGPFIIRSKLLFGIFNVPFFSKIFPSFIENSSFQNTYDPRFFLANVIDDLNNLHKKTFYLSYLNKINWAGSWPYPYYIYRNSHKNNTSQFSYSFLRDDSFSNKNYDEKLSAYNKLLYKNAHKMILDLYLEPLIEYMSKKQILNKSIVTLFSTHSENFNDIWASLNQVPTHGAWVPPYDNSYETVLWVHKQSQGESLSISEQEYPMHKIALQLMNNQSHEQPADVKVYESDWWPAPLVPNEIDKFKPQLVDLNYQNGLVHLSQESNKIFKNIKTRGINWNNVYYSLLATDNGYFWVCWSDENCNLLLSLEKFKEVYSIDLKNKYLPDFQIEKNYEDKFLKLKFDPKNYSIALKSINLTGSFNAYQNLNSPFSKIFSLLQLQGSNSKVASLLISQALKFCSPLYRMLDKLESNIDYPESVVDIIENISLGALESNYLPHCWENQRGFRNEKIRAALLKNRFYKKPNELAIKIQEANRISKKVKNQNRNDRAFWLSEMLLEESNDFYSPAEILYGLNDKSCQLYQTNGGEIVCEN